jgi:hypothetical protein
MGIHLSSLGPGKWYQIIAFYQIAGMIDARLCAPRSLLALEPAAAVGYPPAQEDQGNRCQQRPYQRKRYAGDEAEKRECHPKYFVLHKPAISLSQARKTF